MNSNFKYLIFLFYFFFSFKFANGLENNLCKNNYYQSNPQLLKINEIEIDITKKRNWYKNILGIYSNFASSDTIDSKFKKKFNANLIVKYSNGNKCEHKAKVKVTGLSKFHFSKENYLSSLDVKLTDGHINNIIRFRLLLPNSRANDNEIFFSTLLKDFEIIVPDTRYINGIVNGKKQKYIFQEKLSKELLENNSLREGPIYVLSNKHQKSFSKIPSLKVENSSWVKNDFEKFYDSSEGLSKLNDAYIISESNIKYLDTQNLNHNHNKFEIYNTLLLATNSTHGLGIYNRALYYDPIFQTFNPIYNDPKPSILNETNLEDNNFIKNINEFYMVEINPKFVLDKLSKLDIVKFKQKLEGRNLFINEKKITSTIKLINSRVNYLISSKLERNNGELKNHLRNFEDKYDDLYNYIFINNVDDNVFLKCKNFINCTNYQFKNLIETSKKNNKNFNKYIFSRFLNQDFLDKKDFYIGSKDYDNNFKEKNHKNFKKYFEFQNFEMLLNDGIKINDIDYENKIINIIQLNNKGKIIFTGKEIDSWNINFQGLINDFSINNFRNLTGCITFIDLEVKNISIDSNGGSCEDSINFIRVNGTVKNFNSKNSISDGLDNDFSKIIFENINIENSQNDCLDFSYGNYMILNGNFNKCGDKAISVGETSNVEIENIIINNSSIGIASKDNSNTKVLNGKIRNVEVCISAYKKKQEFSGGMINFKNLDCANFLKRTENDKFSKIIVNNKT